MPVSPPFSRSLKIALAGLAFYFALMGWLPLAAALGNQPPGWVTGVAFWGLMTFTIGHAVHTWGGPRALAFLAWAGGVTWTFEVLGVHTGWPFGAYVYTSPHLRPKVLGVPVFVPLVWAVMAYPAWHLAHRAFPHGPRWLKTLMAAWALTSWDLLADPLLVNVGQWRWLSSGAYFGIPVQNYLGWLLTASVVFAGWGWPAMRADGDVWPWLAYAGIAVLYVVLTWQAGLHGAALAGGLATGAVALWSLPHFWPFQVGPYHPSDEVKT